MISYDKNLGYTVEVASLLKGSTPKPGEKVDFTVGGLYGPEEPPKSVREPMLYFVDGVEVDKDEHRTKCTVKTRLPLGAEKEVLAALRRRDEYPIVEVQSEGTTERCREVMFRGSVESAIQFLGSESQAAVTLAMSTLAYRKDSARDKIVAAIERDMFRNTEEHSRQFQRLRHLIRLLGRMDAGATNGPLAGLLDKELQHLASRPAEPPPLPKRGDWPHYDEVDREDVNHTLAWLAVAMDRQVLARGYGERLVKLRDSLDGRWKAEVTIALDVANVEDTMERAKADPDRIGPSVRSAGRIYQSAGVCAMAFSPDSKYLATGGRDGLAHIWNTADWTCAGSQASRYGGPTGFLARWAIPLPRRRRSARLASLPLRLAEGEGRQSLRGKRRRRHHDGTFARWPKNGHARDILQAPHASMGYGDWEDPSLLPVVAAFFMPQARRW